MDSSESSDSNDEINEFPPSFTIENNFKFLGREWLFLKLSKHLNDSYTDSKNVLLIYGNIGTGKTKLTRQLVQSNEFKNHSLAYYEVDDDSDDISFVLELVKQLKKRIPYLRVPNYLQLEKDKQNSLKEYSSNESLFNEIDHEDSKFFKQRKLKTENDIFWTYFLFPLMEFGLNRWETEKYLIFIDSVDLKNEIYELICRYLHLLPKFLYLVLTARPKRQPDLFQKFSDSRKFQLDDMRILDLNLDLNLGCTIYGLYLAIFSKLFDKDRKIQYFYKSILSLLLASQNNQLNRTILNSLFINTLHVETALNDLEYFQLIKLTYNEDGDQLINLIGYSIEEWLNDCKLSGRKYFCNQNFGNLLLVNIIPNITHNQLCYQIDKATNPVFEIEHKLIWLLLECDQQQFNLLDTLNNSETAKELCIYKSKLRKNNQLNLDEIYQTIFTTNLFYENFRPISTAYNEQTLIEKNPSLLNLNKNKTTGLPISLIDQKVLSTFSNYLLKSIEPSLNDEKKISPDYDVILLIKSIENLDLNQIKRILEMNPDLVNKYADDDLTPLFYAIKTENKQIIELLIEFNVDVNQQSCEHERQTPLMFATHLNLLDISLILLENDADIDATNISGQTAIVYAILYKTKPRLIELLLYWGANINYLDSNNRNLILLACINADANLETVRLLFNYGLNIFHQDNLGKSCLHLASVHEDNYELIEYLVEIGRDELILIKDNEGKLPIHYAIIYSSPLLIPLLGNERSINEMSLDGFSPLRLAAIELQYDCLHTLIDCGANINSLDQQGRSCLYYLSSTSEDNPDKLKMMKELIKLGANLELRASENNTTCLHIASFKSYEKTVTLLLSAGAEVNSIDDQQRNALHLVCINDGNINIMRKLIEFGIEIDCPSAEGKTPLMICLQKNLYDSCKLLLEYGADVWRRDEYGNNLRDLLISYNQDVKISKLFEKYFGILNTSDYDLSNEQQQQQQQQQQQNQQQNRNLLYPVEACSPSPVSNNMNLSSITDLCFNLSIDKEEIDEPNSMQGEFSRSWMESADNLNSNNCSPMQSTYNMSNMNYFTNYNSSSNLKINPLSGSHNHLTTNPNPKLLSPNFQRTDSDDIVTKKDKRSNSKISSISNKFSRFLH